MVLNFDTGKTGIRIAIGCQKTDSRSRKRAPVLIAQYCPLCGARYLPGTDEVS